jgi:hypothetical protein
MRQNGTEKQGLSSLVSHGSCGRSPPGAVDLRRRTAYVLRHKPKARQQSHLGVTMSGFDERKKGQEAKFAFDAEKKFRAEARRNKLLGLWAAELMSLEADAAKAYATEVVASDFQEAGDEDVFRKVSGDLKAKGVAVSDQAIREKMLSLIAVASEQIASEG